MASGPGSEALSHPSLPNLRAFAQAGLPSALHGFEARLTGVYLHESLLDPSFSKSPKDRICVIYSYRWVYI